MKIKYIPFIILAAVSMAMSLFGQNVVTIHDPVRKAEEKTATAAEEKLVTAEAVPKVLTRWKDIDGCDGGNLNIIGGASGAFTSKGSRQRAVLYELCHTGNGFANGGLAILEGEKIVAHFASEGGWNLNIAALPDINRNGLNELVVEVSGGMHQGYTGSNVTMLEVSTAAVKELGWFLVYTNECAKGGPGQFCDSSYKITAKPAAAPIFYRQKYENKGSDETPKWAATGKQTAVKPEKVSFKYVLVK